MGKGYKGALGNLGEAYREYKRGLGFGALKI